MPWDIGLRTEYIIYLVGVYSTAPFLGYEEFANRQTLGINATLSATSAAACWAKLFIYRTFCWKNSVQPTKAPIKMTDTNPILVRIGCQYNHLFLFRSVSFSLCFICCTFWAVLAFLSSRIRFRRTLWIKTNKRKCLAGFNYSNIEDGRELKYLPPHTFFNSFKYCKKRRKKASIF